MRYNRVKLNVRNITVNRIDASDIFTLTGETHQLYPRIDPYGTQWYTLDGTNYGLTAASWEFLQSEELVQLFGTPDVIVNGISFPIKSERDLTTTETIIAYLYRGKLLCQPCSKKYGHNYPDGIEVRARHIIPYSQDCHHCGLMLVEMQRTQTGFDVLFKKYVAPVIVKGKK